MTMTSLQAAELIKVALTRCAPQFMEQAGEGNPWELMEQACHGNPWEWVDMPAIQHMGKSTRPSGSVAPLSFLTHCIEMANRSRDGSIGKIRAPLLKTFKVLLEYGYTPPPAGVVELIRMDPTMALRVIGATVQQLSLKDQAEWVCGLMAQPDLPLEASQHLIQAGVDPNLQSSTGLTPLLALWERIKDNNSMPGWRAQRYKDHTLYWLAAGADPTIKGPSGKSVGDWVLQKAQEGALNSLPGERELDQLLSLLSATSLQRQTTLTTPGSRLRARL